MTKTKIKRVDITAFNDAKYPTKTIVVDRNDGRFRYYIEPTKSSLKRLIAILFIILGVILILGIYL